MMKRRMTWFKITLAKKTVALAATFLGTMAAFAISAHPGLGTVRQPDGTEVRIRLHGDKWSHWHEDEAGYTVIREEASKAWVYADLDASGEFKPTSLHVGKADPSRTLKKGLRSKSRLSKAGKAREMTRQQEQEQPEKTSTRGTLRNLVILVQFPNLKFRYGKSAFENLYNQTGYSTSGACGSVKDYYREVSYGQLNLESIVVGPVTVSRNYANYGENASDSHAVKDMVAEALSLIDQQGFDFSQCDVDGDGQIDGLDIIHAGYGAEFSGNSEDYIWSHKWQLRSAVTYDGVRISNYHTEAEIYGWESSPSGNSITHIGVICHETGHFLGLPDLYDTDNSSEGAGEFCIMAGGSWNGGGKRPAHMSAWCKARLGWVTPTVISATGDYTLPQVENNRTIYKLRGNFSSASEYFLIENRQGYGFDADLPGTTRGMLIWHVDDTKSSNSNENHYWVDLEEASGTQHLQQNTSSGDDADYWRSSTRTSFSASSTPNSSSYSGEALGITISSISASGSTMTFRATVDGGSAIPLGTALDNTSLTFTTGGSASWTGQNSQTHDGVDAARSGGVDHSQQTWLQTTVTGQGTVSFWWYASSELNYDFLEFLVDGEVKASMSGTGNSWTSKSFSITSSGSHTLQWRYRKDGSMSSGLDAGFVDQVAWTPAQPATYTVTYKPGSYGSGSQQTATKTQDVALTLKGAIFTRSGYTQTGWSTSDGGAKSYNLSASYTANASVTLYPYWTASTPSISLGTALDDTSLTFTTGGSASWTGQNSQTHDGVDAARSGEVGHGQQTWLQTTVTGPGTVSFWWYASSEANYDYLEFLVDGEVKASMSGTANSWTSKSFSITSSGSHTLQWRYRKDGSVSSGLDAGFVDQITWNASAPVSPDLYFAARAGWSAPVVVSASSANATNSASSGFTSTDSLYVSWSITCANKDVGGTFYSRLLVDGVQQMQWYTSGLKEGRAAWVTAYGIGKLSVGTHVIKVETDSTGVVGESNEGNNTYTRTITVVRGNVPGNDDFAAATALSGSYGETTGTTADATSQSGEPLLQYKSSARNTVWWKWRAPSSGQFRFTTEGSAFDTVMGVYTGYSLSYLTAKAQDDDGAANRTSACTFTAVAGTTYYICVAGYNAASGTVKLSWRPMPTLVVKLNANGGSVSGVAWKPVKKSAAVGSLKKPTRAGYSFAGWYTKKSGGTKVTSKTKISKNVTYYAHWTAKKYAVTLKKVGSGTVSGGGKKAYKSKITLIAKPASGYVFLGWYKDGAFVSGTAKWTTTVPLNGVTYTAKFAKRSASYAAAAADGGANAPERAEESTAVESVPAFAVGTFNGWSYAENAAGEFLPARKVTVAVTGDGKISAAAGDLKFSGDWSDVSKRNGGHFVTLRAVRTVGTGADAQDFTDILSLSFDGTADWTVDQLTGVLATYKGAVTAEEAENLAPENDDVVVSARRNPFGDNEEAKSLAADLAARGVRSLVDGDGLAWLVKVAENGVATVVRVSEDGGTSASATAVVAAKVSEDGTLSAVVRFLASGRVVEIEIE